VSLKTGESGARGTWGDPEEKAFGESQEEIFILATACCPSILLPFLFLELVEFLTKTSVSACSPAFWSKNLPDPKNS
jgi:hypothetical protein